MLENGLLYAGNNGQALTWMDVVSNGKAITARDGLAVEVNALWYNAIRMALDFAADAGDKKIVEQWESLPMLIQKSFVEVFWDAEKSRMADVVKDNKADYSVRPNMLLAVSLPYSPLNDETKSAILNTVRSELLTTRGLRSLSPKNPKYKGILWGNQEERDQAYHQGTVFPWLIDHFAEAWLNLQGKSALTFVKELYHNFEEVMYVRGLGTISEVYDGDPPHEGRGAISQAWNVAALLRLRFIIQQNQ